MRLTPPAIALAMALATVSSVGHGARPQVPVNPQSAALVASGQREAAAGRFDVANNLFESALAVDPRNREAFMSLASVASRQGLTGKAIRMYREVLTLDPNDVGALAGQGEAMVAKGAVTRARENLAKVRTLCVAKCTEEVSLAAAIERGNSGPALSAQAVTPKPTVSDAKAQ